VARAVIGWLPIAFGIGWLAGELTGCGRFAASCDGTATPVVLFLQGLLLAVLVLVPALASIAVVAAMTLLGAAVVASLVLSATGAAADSTARQFTLGSVLPDQLACRSRHRRRPQAARAARTRPSRILTTWLDATARATCRRPPRSISSPSA
jgi:hypothetical protein